MIIFSDYDDTLYVHNSPEATRNNLESVKLFREKGNIFCLASGRSFSSIERHFAPYGEYFDYMILDNGAVCIDSTGKTKFEFEIAKEIIDNINAFVAENFANEKFCTIYYYNNSEHQHYNTEPVTKLRIWTRNGQMADTLTKAINDNFSQTVKAYVAHNVRPSTIDWVDDNMQGFVDIAAIDAGKEQAIERLANEIAPGEDIVTIGDSSNDIAMLKRYNGYAVANAISSAKEAVSEDHIVNSVAELINKLMEVR